MSEAKIQESFCTLHSNNALMLPHENALACVQPLGREFLCPSNAQQAF